LGEARYYLVAEFKNKRRAEIVYRISKVILDDLAKFCEDWQSIRINSNLTVEERHQQLLQKHPLVAKYIEIPKPDNKRDINMNYLAGKCEMNSDYILQWVNKRYLFLSCYVWHLANWKNIVEMFHKLGASKVLYMSDEDSGGDVYYSYLVHNLKRAPEWRGERYDLKELKRITVVSEL